MLLVTIYHSIANGEEVGFYYVQSKMQPLIISPGHRISLKNSH